MSRFSTSNTRTNYCTLLRQFSSVQFSSVQFSSVHVQFMFIHNSLTFSVQPFKCQVSAAAIAVFNFSVHCAVSCECKGCSLMGNLPVCPLKVKIHFSAMYTSYSLTKLLCSFQCYHNACPHKHGWAVLRGKLRM